MRATVRGAISTAMVAMLLTLGACGDSTSVSDKARSAADEARSAADDVRTKADEALARGQAEALRERVKDLANGDTGKWRDIALLRQAAKDLPGSPDVTGVVDDNGDGKDDDGHVEIVVNDSRACVAIDGQIDVHGGAC
jgi:hypothetical protein